jgi:hypothetical protein
MEFYAHSIEGKLVEEWHWLTEHLKGTAELAKEFAAELGCGEWGYPAGLWHDLGKYSIEFKVMLQIYWRIKVAPRAGVWIVFRSGVPHARGDESEGREYPAPTHPRLLVPIS